MTKSISSFIVLCVLSVQAIASGPYTFRDGLYWNNGQSFSRTQSTIIDQFGCTRVQYHYSPVAQQVVKEVIPQHVVEEKEVVLDYRDENWRDLLAKYAVKQKESQQDHEQFIEALKTLGLGDGQPQNVYGNSYPNAFAPQGTTVYGYESGLNNPQQNLGYSTVADVYNKYDIALGMNQAARLAENAQNLSGQSTTQFVQLLEQIRQGNTDVAQTMALSQAVREFLTGVSEVQNGQKVRVRVENKVGTGQPSNPPEFRPAPERQNAYTVGNERAFLAMVQSKCVSCHSADDKKGGLDMTKFSAFSADKKRQIFNRIVEPNPDLRMPKTSSGPGKPLNAEEILLFASQLGKP